MEFVTHVADGQYYKVDAWRSNLKGVLNGPAYVYWNISKE
jgi:hypothetical protein